uniref:Cupin type-1 domain-containing protein n=1 Tax=Leersia perrieri TaxID=77586 RepID=A0A0D9VBU2_9ORYZ
MVRRRPTSPRREKLGCGLLTLKPYGFTMPHYTDSPQIGLRHLRQRDRRRPPSCGGGRRGGAAVVGEERVVRIAAGEATWWYNDDDEGNDGEDVVILFMADTAGAVVAGEISYFILATATGWSRRSRRPPRSVASRYPFSLGCAPSSCKASAHASTTVNAVATTGTLKLVTAAELPMLEEIRISGGHLLYVAKGSGRVQLAGAGNGGASILLDAPVEEGSLIVVPPYAVALVGADAGGIEFVSLIKSPRPAVERFTGKGSILGGLTPEIVKAALNVLSELAEDQVSKQVNFRRTFHLSGDNVCLRPCSVSTYYT